MDNRCIHGLDALPATLRGCALTIGNFDGVHLGHQRIITAACELARRQGRSMVAMTFEPPPDQVVRPRDVIKRITPVEVKAELLLEAGADAVVLAAAGRDLLSMTPQQFIDEVVVRRFAPGHVVEGPDFCFGHKRSGNVETLRQAGATAGFEAHVIEPVQVELAGESHRVSSTLIRSLVEDGRVADARRCLGRDFALYGQIVHGTGRGAQILGFPTVNLLSPQQVVPGEGVYAGWADIDGTSSAAAISVGHTPTLGGTGGRVVEAHLIGMTGRFYDLQMKLRFTERLRGQTKFESVEALRAQIAEDIERVRRIIQ